MHSIVALPRLLQAAWRAQLTPKPCPSSTSHCVHCSTIPTQPYLAHKPTVHVHIPVSILVPDPRVHIGGFFFCVQVGGTNLRDWFACFALNLGQEYARAYVLNITCPNAIKMGVARIYQAITSPHTHTWALIWKQHLGFGGKHPSTCISVQAIPSNYDCDNVMTSKMNII